MVGGEISKLLKRKGAYSVKNHKGVSGREQNSQILESRPPKLDRLILGQRDGHPKDLTEGEWACVVRLDLRQLTSELNKGP